MIKDGEKRIRIKGRERYATLIDEWQATIEGSRIRKGKCRQHRPQLPHPQRRPARRRHAGLAEAPPTDPIP